MTHYIRHFTILIFLLGLGLLFFFTGGITTIIDKRPVKNILYIGNSFTFINDVPMLVNAILDSTKLPYQYKATQKVVGGATLKNHWNNPDVQQALTKKWDLVIIQPQSTEITMDFVYSKDLSHFHEFGGYLIDKALRVSPRVALYETWMPIAKSYGHSWWFNDANGNLEQLSNAEINQLIDGFYIKQNTHYTKLAHRFNNTDIVDVRAAWYSSTQKCPNINLYGEDNHHASLEGSYLAALMIARYINQNNRLPDTVFVPRAISVDNAKCLRDIVNF